MYPVFLSISGKSCVIVGGGDVALRKAHDLIEEGADITVVAERPSREIIALSDQGLITLETKRFESSDVENAFIVFAATDDNSVNTEIATAARNRKVLLNVVDTPELCDFFSGATVTRGPLRIAVSTSGCSPGIAGRIRTEIAELYPSEYYGFISDVGEMRQHILSLGNIDTGKKNAALSWLAQKETQTLFFEHGKEKVWKELKKIISS